MPEAPSACCGKHEQLLRGSDPLSAPCAKYLIESIIPHIVKKVVMKVDTEK